MTDNGVVTQPSPTDYPLAPAVRARLMGVLLAVLGLFVFAFALVVMFAHLSPLVLGIVLPVVVVAVSVGGYLLTRRAYVVRAGAEGYQVRFVRGAGVHAARWADVHDVATAHVGDDRCVVLRLRDGRTTTIPVDVLAGDREQFVRDLKGFLDAAHGYTSGPRSGRPGGGG